MKAAFSVALLLFSIAFITPVFAYTISGDKIIYDGTLGRVTQEPYLLTDMSNEVELEFTSYFAETEYLDIAFGFNLPDAQPTTALYYNPRTEYLQRSYTCEEFANWTTDPNYMWCWKTNSNTSEYELEFDHSFAEGNVQTKTITWLEPYNVEWTDISDKFTKISYDWNGKNTWYVIENVEFIPDVMKTLKLDIDVLPNTDGKYDIFVKRNADTFNWAISNDQYILLDPWWNTTYPYCRNITVANPKADHQSYINLTYSGNMQADFDDIRFVNTTCNNGGGALSYLLRNKTDSVWASFDLLLDGTQNISVYYGNAGVASVSSVTDVWGASLEGYWTFDIGAGATTKDISGNGHDGTLTAADWNVSGIKGGSVNMGAARTSIITVGDHNDFEPATTLTMVAWVRRNASQIQYCRVFEKYFGAGSPYASWNLNLWDGAGAANRPSEGLGNGGIWTTTYTQVLDDQVWYMLVATYDGANARKYINGSIEGAPVAHSETLSYSTGDVTIGNRVGGANQLEGWLDEIQFYSRNLSDTEISNMYALVEPTFTVAAEQANVTESPPRWSLNISEYPANYDATNTTLSITWANGSTGTIVDVNDVNITTNITGSNVTNQVALISGSSLSGVYNLTDLIGAGTYFWYSSAGNNNSQSNTTPEWFFSIAKATSTCDVYANGLANDSNITYPNLITVYGTCTNPEGDWDLWKNVSVNISAQNNTPYLYGVDYAFFKSNVTATDNYTAASSYVAININQGNLTNESYTNITYNVTDPMTQYDIVNVTCNIPVGTLSNEFKLYNDTAELGNTTAAFNATELLTLNFTCNSTGNANWTAGEATNTLIVGAAGGFIISGVYNENNITEQLTFDVEIYNTTYSDSDSGITSYNNGVVTGNITVVISATGYGTRSYYVVLNDTGSTTLVGYLVNSTVDETVTFTVKSYSEELLTDAEVNISRLIPTETLVTNGITDDTGKFVTTWDGTAPAYIVLVAKTGYTTREVTLTPTTTAYTIYLSATSLPSTPSYWDFYSTATGSCGFDNTTRLLNCTWASTSSDMDNITLNVTKMSNTSVSSSICGNTSTSLSGSFICAFGAADNSSFAWQLLSRYDDTAVIVASGTWTDISIQVFGESGVWVAFLLILIVGMVGVSLKSPVLVVAFTTVGVGLSFVLGLLEFSGGMITFIIGLLIAAGILIYKLR